MNRHNKRLLIIAGPNGSGKSSLVTSAFLDLIEDKIINPDNYARGITGIHDDSDRYLMAMDMCKVIREDLLSQGVSFGFETVASREDKIEFAQKAKQLGYEIVFLFVTTGDPEICCERIKQRVAAGGHDVPRDKVYSRFERTMTFLPTYIKLSDRAEVFDNSGSELVPILSKKNNTIIMSESALDYKWVKRYLSEFL